MSLGAQSTWIKANLEFGHDQMWKQRPTISSKSVRFSLYDDKVQRFSLSVMRFNSVHSMFELGISASKSITSGNYGEFVDTFRYDIQIGSIEKKSFALMMEYGYNISISKSQPNMVRSFWAAFFINPYYKALNFNNPIRALDFPAKNHVTGFGLGLSPRILFPLGSNFLLDFNVKITLLSLQVVNQTFENPALTPRQRTSSVVEEDTPLSKITARIGLAWKFPSRKKKILE
jgi:hypothetical protein